MRARRPRQHHHIIGCPDLSSSIVSVRLPGSIDRPARAAFFPVVDEPASGIDVGAKAEVYAFMRQLVADGVVILFISLEPPGLMSRATDYIFGHPVAMGSTAWK